MDGSFVVKGNIIWSESLSSIKSMEDSFLVVEEGKVKGVFKTLPSQYSSLSIYDSGNGLVVPGLSDIHVHAPQFGFRGTNLDLELMSWLDTYTFPEESRLADEEYADKVYSLFVSTIAKSATTRLAAFATRHTDATLALMDKIEEAGLSGFVGKVNMDRNAPDSLREESADYSASETERWLKAVEERGYSNVKPILTPRFIPSCTDALMEKLSLLRDRYNLPVQSHLSENMGEVEFVKELSPTSAFYGDAYDRFGLFGGEGKNGCIMAHCVLSGEDEISLIKKNGVYVAHCPESNANLKSGIAPLRRYLDEGIKVGLGSDIAGGTTESIFDAMIDAVKMSKMYWRLVDDSKEPLSFKEAFFLGTKGGGSFFGKVGSFEEGYEADILVLSDFHIPYPRALSPLERLERFAYLHGDINGLEAKWVKGRRLF